MEIIQERQYVAKTRYYLEFAKPDGGGATFIFDCSESGEVDKDVLTPPAWDNYLACASGANGYIKKGLRKEETGYYKPAVGRCVCGELIQLDSSWSNLCECGREYNMSGQLLANRSLWGEETNEQF